MADKTIWGIHAGKTGDAERLFLQEGTIAVGWDKVPDLSTLGETREAFKIAVSNAYPNKKPGAIPNNAGQLFRFAREIAIGDYVAYPSKRDRLILVTLGTFTRQAKDFARSKANLRLVDGEELVDLILNHYENFDSTYKGVLPLQRVYVPQPVGESDEEE